MSDSSLPAAGSRSAPSSSTLAPRTSALWAPRRQRVEVVSVARQPRRADARGRRLLQRHDRRRRRRSLSVQARRRREAVSGSGVALSAGRTARSVGDRRSVGVPLDRRGVAGRVARRAGHLRAARRHVHARGHVGGGGARAARARAARHHGDRGDAGRRVRRPLRLGLRRRRSLRAVAPATARPTTSAASSTRRTPPASASSSTSSTTTSGRRATTCASSRPPTSPTATRTSGATRSTSTATDAGPVREFFIANAGYWIDEFHLDGLRLDATQSIHDRVGRAHPRRDRRRARAPRRARGRFVIVAENEPQETRLVRPLAEGGYGLDALWNDDFHHSAMVALTGRAEAYYTDTRGAPQEFISAAKYGYLFQGQHYAWQRDAARHAGLRPAAVGVRRLHAEPRSGRELGARAARPPADQPRPLARDDRAAAAAAGDADAVSGAGVLGVGAVSVLRRLRRRARRRRSRNGRGEFLTAVSERRRVPSGTARSTDPGAPRDVRALQARFRASASRTRRRTRCTATCCASAATRSGFVSTRAAAASTARCCRQRRSCCASSRRTIATIALLVVNLGADLQRGSFAEPLLAPPPDCDWHAALVERATRRTAAPAPPNCFPTSWWHIPGGIARAARRRARAGRGRRCRGPPRGRPEGETRCLNPFVALPWPPAGSADPGIARHARVARDQRPRRLRLGHGARRDHAALSRPADRRAAGAARPHGDAQPRRRAGDASPTAAASRSAGASDPATRPTRTAPATSPSSASRPACRSGATTSTAS